MSQILFYTGTKAQFDALSAKNDNALYFLTDVNKLYKGSTAYTQSVEVVDDFPTAGTIGVIYVKSGSYEVRTWNGTGWITMALPIVTSIGDNSGNQEIPSALAVKSYVDGQIADVASGVSGAVTDVTFANKSISVQKGSGAPVETALSGFFDGVSYDGATGVLSFTANGGETKSVTLPVENFLSAASFDHATGILTLTLTGGEAVTVNLADLVDAYTGTTGATANVSISDGVVSASVNVSGDPGNILQSKGDGLYATVEWNELA